MMRLGAILYVIPAIWAVLHMVFLVVEWIDFRWARQTDDDPHFPGYDLAFHGPPFLIALVVAAAFGPTSVAAQIVLGLSAWWMWRLLIARLASWRGRDWDPERNKKVMKELERKFGLFPPDKDRKP